MREVSYFGAAVFDAAGWKPGRSDFFAVVIVLPTAAKDYPNIDLFVVENYKEI